MHFKTTVVVDRSAGHFVYTSCLLSNGEQNVKEIINSSLSDI